MGIIQKQSIQSSIIIFFGFAIGAFNMIILAPKVLTADEIGLTRIITDAGITLATLCTFGSIPVINKFFPFYNSTLKRSQNDLPFITLCVCMIGFAATCTAGYFLKDIIIRKFSERSPLFVSFSYLVYPYAFFMLLFIWLESFGWSFKKGVLSNMLKETVTRVFFTLLLFFLFFKVISLNGFFISYSFLFAIPSIILLFYLRKTGDFNFNPKISVLTSRLKNKMINFGLFIYAAQFLNLLSRTVDTFLLSAKSSRGLTDAAVFTIATYVVTLMEVPQRSMNAIAIPVLADAWKNKDTDKIASIYKKSVDNLLLLGLVMFPILWLNVHNLAVYLGKDFSGIELVVLMLGIAKLIDLGTGVNAQIIATSNFWKMDFTTNVIYTLVALPLNYLLIDRFGLIGAAYSSIISLTFYNLMRFGFLWIKFGLQPYSYRSLIAVLFAVVCTSLIYFIPKQHNILVDGTLRTVAYLALFIPLVYFSKLSRETNKILEDLLNRVRIIN
jgi:O-antigen/teichoic acid export membrane protein